jgi:hypothetical protein
VTISKALFTVLKPYLAQKCRWCSCRCSPAPPQDSGTRASAYSRGYHRTRDKLTAEREQKLAEDKHADVKSEEEICKLAQAAGRKAGQAWSEQQQRRASVASAKARLSAKKQKKGDIAEECARILQKQL